MVEESIECGSEILFMSERNFFSQLWEKCLLAHDVLRMNWPKLALEKRKFEISLSERTFPLISLYDSCPKWERKEMTKLFIRFSDFHQWSPCAGIVTLLYDFYIFIHFRIFKNSKLSSKISSKIRN